MSESDEGDVEERSVPNRVRSLHATIEKAIERAEESSRYRRKFNNGDIQSGDFSDLPDRTLRRAAKDAETLGWIEKKNQTNWVPGERAKQYADEPEPTPNGWIGRDGDGDWHLLTGGSETICGDQWRHYELEDPQRVGPRDDERGDVALQDVCDDCIGL